MLCGALLGIAEAQAEHPDLEIDPIIANPGGDNARYSAMAAEMLASGIRHVVGCYTSSSRKEIIPLFEKADALLWYPSHYEGFESSSNVVYTGAVANQHLLPLVEYLLSHVGPKAFCVGSNYIWAWENNRILREAIGPNGGTVVAERYFPVGCTEFDQVDRRDPRRAPVLRLQHADRQVLLPVPSRSSRRLRARAASTRRARSRSQAARCPSRSSRRSDRRRSTATSRRASISPRSTRRRTTASSTPIARGFRTVPSCRPTPRRPISPCACWRARWRKRARTKPAPSSGAVALRPIAAPQGEVRIDAETMHASLTPRIARSNAGRRLHHPARSDAARAGRSLPHPQFVALRRRGHPARPAGRLMTTQRLIQNFRRSQGLLWAGARLQRRRARAHAAQARRIACERVEQRRALRDLDPDRDIVFLDADQPINPGAPSAARREPRRRAGHRHRRRRGAEPAQAAGRSRRDRDPAQAHPGRDGLFRAFPRREQPSAAASPRRRASPIGDRKRRGRRFLIKAVVALVQARGLERRRRLRRASPRKHAATVGSRGVLRSPVPAGQQFSGRVARRPRALKFT